MIQCDNQGENCKIWYHDECVGMDSVRDLWCVVSVSLGVTDGPFW